MNQPTRVFAYFDGVSVHKRLRDTKYEWLNPVELIRQFLQHKDRQTAKLCMVRYYGKTAPGDDILFRLKDVIEDFAQHHAGDITMTTDFVGHSHFKMACPVDEATTSEHSCTSDLCIRYTKYVVGDSPHRSYLPVKCKQFRKYNENHNVCAGQVKDRQRIEQRLLLAIDLAMDAVQNSFDLAYLVTADEEHACALHRLKTILSGKEIVLAIPPPSGPAFIPQKLIDEVGTEHFFPIKDKMLKASQFDVKVTLTEGGTRAKYKAI